MNSVATQLSTWGRFLSEGRELYFSNLSETVATGRVCKKEIVWRAVQFVVSLICFSVMAAAHEEHDNFPKPSKFLPFKFLLAAGVLVWLNSMLSGAYVLLTVSPDLEYEWKHYMKVGTVDLFLFLFIYGSSCASAGLTSSTRYFESCHMYPRFCGHTRWSVSFAFFSAISLVPSLWLSAKHVLLDTQFLAMIPRPQDSSRAYHNHSYGGLEGEMAGLTGRGGTMYSSSSPGGGGVGGGATHRAAAGGGGGGVGGGAQHPPPPSYPAGEGLHDGGGGGMSTHGSTNPFDDVSLSPERS